MITHVHFILLGTTIADCIKEFEASFMVLRKVALKEITEKQIPVTDFHDVVELKMTTGNPLT